MNDTLQYAIYQNNAVKAVFILYFFCHEFQMKII